MPTLRSSIRVSDTGVARILFNSQRTLSTFAPVLTWDGDSSDASPDFTAVFDFRAIAGDEVTLEFASDEEFTTDVASYVHDITSGEISGDTLSITVTDLADGTWYARLKHKLVGATYSDWSNIEILTVQVSATSAFLKEDGTSFYLMEDGVSKYLLE